MFTFTFTSGNNAPKSARNVETAHANRRITRGAFVKRSGLMCAHHMGGPKMKRLIYMTILLTCFDGCAALLTWFLFETLGPCF